MTPNSWFWLIIPCVFGLFAPRLGFSMLGGYFVINGAVAAGWLS
jgi:hypothetical protein